MAKKKSMTHPFRKFIPLIVFAAILGAAVFVAAQLQTRQGIAPNAPDSEPAAFVVASCPDKTTGSCKGNKMVCKSTEENFYYNGKNYKNGAVVKNVNCLGICKNGECQNSNNPCRKCTIDGCKIQGGNCNNNLNQCAKDSDCRGKVSVGCGQECRSSDQCANGLTCATSSASLKITRCTNRGQKCISPKVPGPNGCSCVNPPTPSLLKL